MAAPSPSLGPRLRVEIGEPDYCAVNSRGCTVKTFSDLELARKWVADNAHLHDGLHVVEVIISARKRRVYTPRVRPAAVAPLDDDLAIPPPPDIPAPVSAPAPILGRLRGLFGRVAEGVTA